MKNLERICKLQREFKALYEEGDRALVGVVSNSVQVSEKYFFKVFTDYNIIDRDNEYMKVYTVYEGVKFLTLISKKDI